MTKDQLMKDLTHIEAYIEIKIRQIEEIEKEIEELEQEAQRKATLINTIISDGRE